MAENTANKTNGIQKQGWRGNGTQNRSMAGVGLSGEPIWEDYGDIWIIAEMCSYSAAENPHTYTPDMSQIGHGLLRSAGLL